MLKASDKLEVIFWALMCALLLAVILFGGIIYHAISSVKTAVSFGQNLRPNLANS